MPNPLLFMKCEVYNVFAIRVIGLKSYAKKKTQSYNFANEQSELSRIRQNDSTFSGLLETS